MDSEPKTFLSKISIPLAIFGFLLIIATGTSMLLNESQIPPYVAIIGLILLLIATYIQKKEKRKN
jgi:hypothetical protein